MEGQALARKNFSREFANFNRNYFIVYALLGLGAVFAILSPNFLTLPNIMTILKQSSIIAIVSAGQFFVLTGGDFDLSVGSTVSLSGMIFAGSLVFFELHPGIAAFFAILIGLGVGGINGFLVAKVRLPAFIGTMATMISVQGVAILVTMARPINKIPMEVGWIGRGTIGDILVFGVPYMTIIMLIVIISVFIITEKTNFGRYIFAMGGNSEAAYLSGINIKRFKVYTYLISGSLASLASIILVSRLSVGDPYAGSGYEFDSITACVIGGTAITGGKGKIFAVLVGAIFFAMLFNGMTQLNVNTFIQQVLKGVILAVAVTLDTVKNKK